MFGLLGAGLGVGFTTAFFKAQYPDDEAALEDALDALLDNPDFLDLVADEVMFQEYELENDENNAAISRMRNALVNERDEADKAGN